MQDLRDWIASSLFDSLDRVWREPVSKFVCMVITPKDCKNRRWIRFVNLMDEMMS